MKNICSASILRKMGYGLQLLRVPRGVRLCDGVDVIIAACFESGMPYVGLSELLYLPDISKCDRADEVLLSDRVQMDPIELHVNKSKLIEGFKHMLFTGSGLSRKHLSKKYVKSVSAHFCKCCAKAKITRRSFHPSNPEDTQQATKFLERVTADIVVYFKDITMCWCSRM